MSNKNLYAVAVLREMYQPDIQGRGAVSFLRTDDQRDIQDYTLDDAREMVEELDDEVYVTSNGEAGRPEYVVIPYDDAAWISEGRNSDMSNYNWDDAACNCGECATCWQMMIDQDRAYVRKKAAESVTA